jgi:lysophospholipase L1-like esterase
MTINYNNIVCFGDSLTFGARSSGCYPLYLVDMLNKNSPYKWRVINRGINGTTARDLWFRINWEIEKLDDAFIYCLLIGTNDCSAGTEENIFTMYLEQILDCMLIKKAKVILIGEIPQIINDGNPFYTKAATEKRIRLNEIIKEVSCGYSQVKIINFDLDKSCCEDSVHFNEKGNYLIAKSYFDTIINQ